MAFPVVSVAWASRFGWRCSYPGVPEKLPTAVTQSRVLFPMLS